MRLIARFMALATISFALVVGLGACSTNSEPESTEIQGATTSTSQGTGDISFDTLVGNVETLTETTDLPGLLPYALLSAGDLDWLLKADLPAAISKWKGYRFANGDVLVLFRTTVPIATSDLLEAQEAALFRVTREQYPEREVWAVPTISYVVATGDTKQMHTLSSLVYQATIGGGVRPSR